MSGLKLHNNKTIHRLICLSVILCATLITSAQDNTDKIRKKSPIDFKASLMQPVKVGDSSALNLLGNVVFHHKDNGTIITCDSAIRYSDSRIVCFKNVVVNKQDTYVYGDSADYNGDLNIANIYGPIIKMVNKDATMYTYKFAFNTLTNIGIFGGGATINQRTNLLESERGYFYADSNIIVCVEDVEIKSPDYKLESDSVEYNLNTDIASFFTETFIWNSKGEILSAKNGVYDQKKTTYNFTSDSYILTAGQELWSDTLNYNSKSENAVLYNNIQLLDEEQKVMLFGNFAEYWGDEGNALITEDPSVINFGEEQPDTLYMRSDTIFIYTIDADSIFGQSPVTIDEDVEVEYIEGGEQEESVIESDSVASGMTNGGDSTTISDSIIGEIGRPKSTIKGDTLVGSTGTDTLSKDSGTIIEEPLSFFERIRAKREIKNIAKEEKRRVKKEANRVKEEAKRAKLAQKLKEKKERISIDSTLISAIDSSSIETIKDTTSMTLADSTELVPVIEEDSVQHVIIAYNNVKIYRTDFQAVCDSLVGLLKDSTMHLHVNPVLWNQANQITSTKIDIYTKNQVIDKAVFVGEPIMASKIGDGYFNQVKGKVIEAIMIDNQIKRIEVTGNGQTYYYMQDDKDGSIKGFTVAESANITFRLDSNEIETITYKTDVTSTLYPMDQIPLTQDLILPGFKWEAARRPLSKKEVFNRALQPSRRKTYESKSQPVFDITKSIFDNKEKMILDGVWRERDEKITESTLDGL